MPAKNPAGKPVRVIRTASGTVTLGQYVAAWKMVQAAPPGAEFKSSLQGWWPATFVMHPVKPGDLPGPHLATLGHSALRTPHSPFP